MTESPNLDLVERNAPPIAPSDKKLRSVGAVTVSLIVGNASEFVAIVLAARVLGPVEFGRFSHMPV
jgi:hypothetical protein